MTQPQPNPQLAPHPIASMPVFKFLAQYIQAAASGDRATIFHLFVAVFVMARAAVRCLAEHYNAHPHQRTLDTYTRLKYCFARIPAILYTIQHAPERFLTPAQLRALTRARAVLAHICNQPVDFSPLTPYLASPENCPPPPRSAASAPISRPSPDTTESSSPSASSVAGPAFSEEPAPSNTHSASAKEANPLLLNSPGCALASVLLQLAAIYGLSASPVSVPRASQSPSIQCAPAASPHVEVPSSAPNSICNPFALPDTPRTTAQPTVNNQQFFFQPPP